MKITEIAALAGVSNAAVSRYLNNGPLSAEKKERIAQVIAKTGYAPDAAARSLRTGKVPQIGVIIPRINSNSVSNVATGISAELMKRNMLCLLANTENNEEKELEYLQTMQDNFCSGIILLATVITKKHERLLSELRVPCVIIGQKSKIVPSVYHDDYHAAKELAELVLARGRRKLCFLGTLEQDVATGLERHRGVNAALTKYGMTASDIRVRQCGFSGESGYLAMQSLLEENDDIDGVLCATDSIAFGAIKALRKYGKKMPEQVSITGFGDNWACNMVDPLLTTVHLYYRESGMEAARMLLEMLDKPHSSMPVRHTMLGYSITERESV